jgi:hypothetical protein
MNLVGAMVGLTVIGTALPMVAEMSLAPVIAQKKANNFSVAESQAVAFAAQNEWQEEVLTESIPDNCSVITINDLAYTISCFQGVDQFRAEASRSFRLYSPAVVDDGNNGHGNDADGVDESNPGNSRVYCPYYDPLGEMKANKHCVPVAE